jgi:hypothetical protein
MPGYADSRGAVRRGPKPKRSAATAPVTVGAACVLSDAPWQMICLCMRCPLKYLFIVRLINSLFRFSAY